MTCVCMRCRPLHHSTWPLLSSISAWSISSGSFISSSSSSGISSCLVPWPAVFRNFSQRVGTLDTSWGWRKGAKGAQPAAFAGGCAAAAAAVGPHLPPQEAAEAQEDAPEPLLHAQAHAAEGLAAKLHNQHLFRGNVATTSGASTSTKTQKV